MWCPPSGDPSAHCLPFPGRYSIDSDSGLPPPSGWQPASATRLADGVLRGPGPSLALPAPAQIRQEFLLRRPEQARSYSSVWDGNPVGTGHARSVLDSVQAWSAQTSDVSQWMIIDAGSRCTIFGVVIQGRGHGWQIQKVTRVRVSVSEDAVHWVGCG